MWRKCLQVFKWEDSKPPIFLAVSPKDRISTVHSVTWKRGEFGGSFKVVLFGGVGCCGWLGGGMVVKVVRVVVPFLWR